MYRPANGIKEWNGDHPFVALDFETADDGFDSACAIALVRVENLQIVRREHRLVRPPRQRFTFTYLHGISWTHVAQMPAFGEVWREVAPVLEGAQFVAAHNAKFDESVLRSCCQRAGLPPPTHRFLCTVELARKTWRVFPTKLPDVCAFLGLSLHHHDACSDAEACANIVIKAWQKRQSAKPRTAIDPTRS